jgi:hypothetical protein
LQVFDTSINHPHTFELLGVDPSSFPGVNRTVLAGIFGLTRNSAAYDLLMPALHSCAKEGACIAPEGPSTMSKAHRFDQTVLNIALFVAQGGPHGEPWKVSTAWYIIVHHSTRCCLTPAAHHSTP